MKKSKEKSISSVSGFTIIEVMMGVFGFTIIAIGVVVLISSALDTAEDADNVLTTTDQARKVAFAITDQLRRSELSNTGAAQIALADDREIIFYSDLDGGSDIERIRYYESGGKLYRGVVKPSGVPLSYDINSEITNEVLHNLSSAGDNIFYYYDGSYDGVTDSFLATPASQNEVKYVKVNFDIINTAGKTNTNTYQVVSGATVRNLKTNIADP